MTATVTVVTSGASMSDGSTVAATTPTATTGPQAAGANIVDFAHQDVTVDVGTTVTWTNLDSAPHTSTAGQPGSQSDLWNSPTLGSDDTFAFTFNQVGTFPYFCRFHPSMTATVTVVASGASMSDGSPVAAATTVADGDYEY